MTVLEEKQREIESLEAKLVVRSCKTCKRFYLRCEIFRAARDMQVEYIPPEIFWCAWHKETA